MDSQEHFCQDLTKFPTEKFFQTGSGKGKKVLIVGESPAPNGWRKSGKAFYTIDGKLLPSGKRLNELLEPFGLTVETCGFTELVKCFTGTDRRRLFECGIKTWPIFLEQLKLQSFKIIIIMGVETLKIFNHLAIINLNTGKMSKATIGDSSFFVLPIYHTSPVNPHGHKKNQYIFDSVKQELSKLL